MIPQVKRDNPNATQFQADWHKSLTVNSLFLKSSSSNCTEHLDTFMLKLSDKKMPLLSIVRPTEANNRNNEWENIILPEL